MNSTTPDYKNHRFPIEIVARAVWLYIRFNVSLREVEEMMLDRGVVVSYEMIHRWCRTHDADYAPLCPDYILEVPRRPLNIKDPMRDE